MSINIMQLQRFSGSGIPLRFAKGHFATNHSHINYYVDLTMTKHRLSEARKAAAELTAQFKSSTIVDTILCLDGTEVIGACMASQLTAAGISNMNAHQTIYVVTPEHTGGSQLLFLLFLPIRAVVFLRQNPLRAPPHFPCPSTGPSD